MYDQEQRLRDAIVEAVKMESMEKMFPAKDNYTQTIGGHETKLQPEGISLWTWEKRQIKAGRAPVHQNIASDWVPRAVLLKYRFDIFQESGIQGLTLVDKHGFSEKSVSGESMEDRLKRVVVHDSYIDSAFSMAFRATVQEARYKAIAAKQDAERAEHDRKAQVFLDEIKQGSRNPDGAKKP